MPKIKVELEVPEDSCFLCAYQEQSAQLLSAIHCIPFNTTISVENDPFKVNFCERLPECIKSEVQK